MDEKKLQYPECEKIVACQDRSRTISEFLDWLQEQKYELCMWDNTGVGTFYPLVTSKEKLLAEFFEIDLDKVETERRAILDDIRK